MSIDTQSNTDLPLLLPLAPSVLFLSMVGTVLPLGLWPDLTHGFPSEPHSTQLSTAQYSSAQQSTAHSTAALLTGTCESQSDFLSWKKYGQDGLSDRRSHL